MGTYSTLKECYGIPCAERKAKDKARDEEMAFAPIIEYRLVVGVFGRSLRQWYQGLVSRTKRCFSPQRLRQWFVAAV